MNILWIFFEHFMNIFLVFYHPVNDAKQQIQKGEMVLEVCIYFMNISRIFYEYFKNILWIFYHPVDDAKLQIKKRRNKSFMYFMNISRTFYEYCWIFYEYFITQRTMLSHKLEKGEIIRGSSHFVRTFSWGETTSLAPLILFLWIFSLTSFVSNTYNSFHGFWVSWMTKN